MSAFRRAHWNGQTSVVCMNELNQRKIKRVNWLSADMIYKKW